MINYEQMAEQMYAAYCQQAGGLTFDGKPLPSFQELGLERQSCWKAAAKASKMVAPSNLKQLADSFPELNPSNYDAEDVDKLHNWALEVVQAITAIDHAVAPVVLPPHPDTARLQQAVWRLENILKDYDGQAWKEASKFLERLKKEQREEAKPAAPLNVWQQAIDAELVSAHLGVAHNDATFEGAQKAIHELICWHIDVATNPATNGGQRLTDAKPTTGELVMDVRCEGCGYMTHHREHMGCVRAAKQHTHAAPSAAQAAKGEA